MKNKAIVGILSFAMIAGSMFAPVDSAVSNIIPSMSITASAASASIYGDFAYVTNNTGITIVDYRGTKTDVVIPDKINNKKVTAINANTFLDNTSIRKVTLGQYVNSIGNSAFKGCTKLNEIVYNGNPDTTKLTIGAYAFDGCSQLYDVDEELIASAKTISTAAFRNCSELSIDNLDLYNAVSVNNYAFYNCPNIRSVRFYEGITTIGQYAFQGCTRLNTIDCYKNPDQGTIAIGAYAFDGCSQLYEVDEKLFASAKTISTAAFRNCTEMSVDRLDLYNATSVGQYAFYNCHNIRAINLYENATSIGSYAFKGCTRLNTIDCYKSPDQGAITIGSYAFDGCSQLYEVDEKVFACAKTIGAYAFRNCTEMSVNRLDLYNATSVGQYAFYNCSNIRAIELYENITAIGNYAFKGCTRLNTIDCYKSPDKGSITIGSYAFDGCSQLYEVDEKVFACAKTIGNAAFRNCTEMSVDRLDLYNATTVSQYAFYNCKNIRSINFYENIATIGNYAFQSCTKLNTIDCYKSPDQGTIAIGDCAFYNCSQLYDVDEKLFACASTIGASAFRSCTNMAVNIDLYNATSVGNYAFYSCKGIERLNVGRNMKSIGNYAFAYCSNLSTVDWETNKSNVTIGTNAFANTKVTV